MLKERFLKLISKYSDDVQYNIECWEEIKKSYSSKYRHYHNLLHIENMLLELENVKSQIKNLDTILFAIYYHDLVYKTTKTDNEYQSAQVFEKRISKTSFHNLRECKAQIESTKHHKHSADDDTNILLDLDLSILGKSPKEYQKYSENIRKEYRIYPDFLYRRGRTKVIKSMLESDSIFKINYFINKYENQARANLRSELQQLK